MNKTQQIINSMSLAQKHEFEKDIEDMAAAISQQYDGNPKNVAETNVNMRLPDEMYLNVTVLSHRNEQGVLNTIVQKIHQYENVNEYLDAINAAKSPGDDFIKVK